MAASAECRAINKPRPDENETISVLYGKLKNDKLMVKPKYEHPAILQGNLLIHAHVLRFSNMLSKGLRQDLDAMLVKSPDLVDGMIEISQIRKWLETAMATIQFSQFIVQVYKY